MARISALLFALCLCAGAASARTLQQTSAGATTAATSQPVVATTGAVAQAPGATGGAALGGVAPQQDATAAGSVLPQSGLTPVATPAAAAAPAAVPAAAGNATAASAAGATTTSAPATASIQRPGDGTNLVVVMTLQGSDSNAIVRNQAGLKQQVAASAGVPASSVYFFDQSVNTDPRTGVQTVSLVLNVACGSEGKCRTAGGSLYNPNTQAQLTAGLAQNNITLLPSTLQVYNTTIPASQNGNTTLSAAALAAPSPVPLVASPSLGLGLPLGSATDNLTTGVDTTGAALGGLPGFGGLGTTDTTGALGASDATGALGGLPGLGTSNSSILVPDATGITGITANDTTAAGALPGATAAPPAPASPAPSSGQAAGVSAAAALMAVAALALL